MRLPAGSFHPRQHGDVLHAFGAGDVQLGGLVHECAQRLHLGTQFGETEVHVLVVEQALAKGLTFTGVVDGGVNDAQQSVDIGRRAEQSFLLELHHLIHEAHAFLADQMGVELVEGHDLRVVDGHVAMRTTEGYKQIDVLYRRVDDEFLDPLTFRPDSALGVAGIMDVYRAGNITIANAPGTGIADDKAIYSYMPEIVEFYTGRKAILGNIPTWRCSEADSLKYVLEHLEELVVKEVHGSGGYGMLVGPAASRKEREAFAAKLKAKPSNYIAQPTLALSTCPILTEQGLAPRHVDLRPFVLVSDRIRIVPGGLTRVALKEGSLVVNSSQGGGTKDTWVLDD